MSLLLIYALFILILVGVAAIVSLNFLRYRFKGDLTYLFLGIFVLLFVLTIILTFLFVDPAALNIGGN